MRENSRQVLAMFEDLKKNKETTSVAKRKLQEFRGRCERDLKGSLRNLKDLNEKFEVSRKMIERIYRRSFEIIVFTSDISGFSSLIS